MERFPLHLVREPTAFTSNDPKVNSTRDPDPVSGGQDLDPLERGKVMHSDPESVCPEVLSIF